MIADREMFAEHVAAHAGSSVERAERAARATLGALGAHLGAGARELVADELPPALAGALVAGGDLARPLEDHIIEPGETVGHARELIASTCRVLAEELSHEALAALRHAAPQAIADLLVAPSPEREHDAVAPARNLTLATGGPGSRHPISETQPSAPADSIASNNPHAGSKLSSAPDVEHGATLAEGEPGSDHALAGDRR